MLRDHYVIAAAVRLNLWIFIEPGQHLRTLFIGNYSSPRLHVKHPALALIFLFSVAVIVRVLAAVVTLEMLLSCTVKCLRS